MARTITYFCVKHNDLGKTEVKGVSFKCDHCGMKLVYIPKERRIGAHGKTAKTVGHELRQVDEPL